MSGPCSPLRYPGGKQVLSDALCELLRANCLEGKTYLEPYAGGAGAALSLLFGEYVSRIQINDADPAIFSFWNSILNKTDQFLEKLRSAPLSIDEWLRQREIYQSQKRISSLKLGFAAFYLNRCNRSGIIANAGIIGGLQQVGKWKLDARFNKTELEERIKRIALYRDRIDIYNLDALSFLDTCANKKGNRRDSFVYLDPPYFGKGRQLYMNYYCPKDHARLAQYLKKRAAFTWVLTYDDAAEIRSLYSDLRIMPFNLRYSASASRTGSEILITKKDLTIPHEWKNEMRLVS